MSRLASAMAVGVFAIAPAQAKVIELDFTFLGGNVAEYVDSQGSTYDLFVTPRQVNEDWRGSFEVDRISVAMPGTAQSDGGYFDVELFFPATLNKTLSPGQRTNVVGTGRFGAQPLPSLSDAPVQFLYVHRFSGTGGQSFSAAYDFQTQTVTGTPEVYRVRTAAGGPSDTRAFGVIAQMQLWTAAEPTNVAIGLINVHLAGRITQYQLPSNPELYDFTVEQGDDAYNAQTGFTNGLGLTIQDRVTNRAGAMFTNSGRILVDSSAETKPNELINLGRLDNASGGQIENRGAFSNESGATLNNRGRIVNVAGPTELDPANGRGFSNRGSFEALDLGEFENGLSATATNAGSFALTDGRLVNYGTFVNGVEQGAGVVGTLTGGSRGSVRNFGTFTNRGAIDFQGELANDGKLVNAGTITLTDLTAAFRNRGEFGNGDGSVPGPFDPHVSFRAGDGVQVTNMMGGTITNRADFEVAGRLDNAGRFVNSGFDARFTLRGTMTNAADASFENTGGRFEAHFATLANDGRFVNSGEFGLADGSTLQGGQFLNSGAVRLEAGTAMRGLTLYRQAGGDSGLTVANGELQATEIDIQSGVLQGADQVVGHVVIGPGASLKPGNSPGMLVVEGDLLLQGLLDLEIGPNEADVLQVRGQFAVDGGRIRLSFVGGLLPPKWGFYSPLAYIWAHGYSGLDSAALEVAGLPEGYEYEWQNGGLLITQAVPEPHTWAPGRRLRAGCG